MEMKFRVDISERNLDNIYIDSGERTLDSGVLDTNFTIRNTLSLEIEEKYGLKTCLVELERCDKIWETIQLIRHLQENSNTIIFSKNKIEQHEDNIMDIASSANNGAEQSRSSTNEFECNLSSITSTMAPYIKYQPVLDNGNTALPNFQFSVQRTRVLYPCLTCGKQYSHTRSLKEHSERIHNIIIPSFRKKPENIASENTHDLMELKNTIISQYDEKLTKKLENLHFDDITLRPEGKIFLCPFCDKSYKDKYTLNKHIKKIHGKHIGLTRAYNRKHILSDSENSACKIRRMKQSRSLDVYRCKTCGKHFYSSRSIRQHSRKVHGIYIRKKTTLLSGLHKASNAAKVDKSSIQILNSLSKNSLNPKLKTKNSSIIKKLKPVRKCPVCNKTYRDHLCWKTHCKREHGLTIEIIRAFSTELEKYNYDCKICDKKFDHARDVMSHYKNMHHQRLRYKCDICKSLFNEVDNLIKHSSNVHKIFLLLRQNPRRYKICSVCGISFNDQNNLEVHMREKHNKRIINKPKTQMKRNQEQKNIVKTLTIPTKSKLYNIEKVNSADTLLFDKSSNDNISLSHVSSTEIVERIVNNKQQKSSKKLQSSKSISVDTLGSTNCILCGNRQFKNIRKHFTEYHKVRNPVALIAQCSQISSNNYKTAYKNYNKISINNAAEKCSNIQTSNLRLKKSKQLNNCNKKYSSSERLFIKMSGPGEEKFYACKYCSFTSNNYDAMRSDEKRHKRDRTFTEKKPLYEYLNNSLIINKKRKQESTYNRDTRRRRLSPSIDHIRTTRASTKIKEEYYHMCTICTRTFRNTEILKSHKISCKPRVDQISVFELSDTRSSNNRDSGIGISITIKKKNNSYEIVNRDNNEDKPNETVKIQGKQEDVLLLGVTSDNLSTVQNINEKSIECLKYSEHHEFIKIQQAEDLDVDIVSDCENHNNCHLPNQELQTYDDIKKSKYFEQNNENIKNSGQLYQVLPLKVLCQNALVKRTLNNDIDNTSKVAYKCNVCYKTWSSPFSLAAHRKIHLKIRRKIDRDSDDVIGYSSYLNSV